MERTKVEVTADVLMRAYEKADDFEHVIVIYQRKKDKPSEQGAYLGVFESEAMSLETANFMCDSYKVWLWSNFRSGEEDQ